MPQLFTTSFATIPHEHAEHHSLAVPVLHQRFTTSFTKASSNASSEARSDILLALPRLRLYYSYYCFTTHITVPVLHQLFTTSFTKASSKARSDILPALASLLLILLLLYYSYYCSYLLLILLQVSQHAEYHALPQLRLYY
jgi:hypothetical protein